METAILQGRSDAENPHVRLVGAALGVFCLLFGAMVARAGNAVTYWDPKDGKSVTESCERITAETTTLADGKWYYVEGNVEMTHGLALENEAHIILTDESRLVIRPPSNTPGIAVRYSALDCDDLFVYGQEKGTGKLEVQGGEYAAGIGIGYFGVGGTVTICGGTVTATGGNYGAGIGCDKVTICGGTVMATGGFDGAGIGGGYDGAGGTVTISGGTVTATGGFYGAGIGGGYCGDGGTTLVLAGTVKAKGGECAANIGAGCDSWDDGETICPPGTEITGEIGDRESEVSVEADAVGVLFPVAQGLAVKATDRDGMELDVVLADGLAFVSAEAGDALTLAFSLESRWHELSGETTVKVGPLEGLVVLGPETVPQTRLLPVEYVDADGTLRTADACMLVTEKTRILSDGWYVVAGAVSRAGIDVATGCTANLILADGASLTVRNDFDRAGIDVSDGETLNIYGQRLGTGRLEATGGYGCAGVGGVGYSVYSGACGTVTVNGGTVTATGGEEGAGIGGGGNGGKGGVVTVNGGTVMATGGTGGGAGIGGGSYGDGGTATVDGGVVMAIGRPGSQNIGHGCDSSDPGTVSLAEGITVVEGEVGAVDSSVCLASAAAGVILPLSAGLSLAATNQNGQACQVIRLVNGRVLVPANAGDSITLVFTKTDDRFAVTGNMPLTFGPLAGFVTVDPAELPLVTVGYRIVQGGASAVASNCIAVTSETLELAAGGWYVVADDVTLLKRSLDVCGSANLILMDGACLSIHAPDYFAALAVRAGSALTVYGQDGGSGELSVFGGEEGAGIGGGCEEGGGTVTINGGVVTATGGYEGAGIGGGEYCAGGTVVVNGGVVTATGGDEGAGIGGGYDGDGGAVMVFGGTVTARGGFEAANIGAGSSGSESGRTVCSPDAVVMGEIGALEDEVVIEADATGVVMPVARGLTVAAVTDQGGQACDVVECAGFAFVSAEPGDTLSIQFAPADEMHELEGRSTVHAGPLDGLVVLDKAILPRAWHLVNPYLGNPSLRFFDETDVTWIPDGEVMRSGVIADRGRTALSALAEGEGTLSFCWKVSSEAFCDKLHVLLDGKEVCDWISGTDMEEWRNVTFRVDGKGEHTVTWSYTKDGGTSRGSDCGWIDSVTWTPDEAGPTCEGGTIAPGEDGTWVVTLDAGVTAVTITGLPAGATIAAVKVGESVIPAAAFMGFGTGENANVFSLALNPNGKVTIGEKEIPVKPTIDEGAFVTGEGSVAISVETIPGLLYELKSATDLGADFGTIREGVKVIGDGNSATLTDIDPPTDKAFYRVEVSVQ